MTRRTYIGASVVLLALVHLAITSLYTPASFYISDEITYMRMAQAMAEHGRLWVWNDFHDHPYVSLILGQTSPMLEQIYPKYPAFYALIAAPFFLLAGIKGLFLLNACALLGVLWLTYRLSLLLFDSQKAAALAVITLMLGSYIWVQSQSIWPHLTALFFQMGALYCVAKAWREGDADSRYMLLAGLSFSAALAIRLDSLFLAPVLAAPFCYIRPIAWKPLFTMALTSSFGVLFLGVTNMAKFGTLNPFSYGHTLTLRVQGADYTQINTSHFTPLMVVGALFLAGFLWPHAKQRAISLRHYSIGWLVAGMLLCLCFYDQALLGLQGMHDILWNFKAAPNELPARASLLFSDAGYYLYDGSAKRALLQSCPFILLGLAPLILRRHFSNPERYAICWLWASAGMYMLFYGLLDWDGGYGYNMRYLLPALPVLSIAAAFAVQRLLPTIERWLIGAAAIVVAITMALHKSESHAFGQLIPLVLCLATAVLLWDATKHRLWQKPCLLLVAISLVWGGITSMLIHYPQYSSKRELTLHTNQKMAQTIADDALFIGPEWQVSMLGLWGKSVRLFNPALLSDDEIRAQFSQFMQEGVAIYLSPNEPKAWEPLLAQWGMQTRGLPNGLRQIIQGTTP